MANAVFDNNSSENSTGKDVPIEKVSNDSYANPSRRLSATGDVAVKNTYVYNELPFWTRMGCTPDSFKPRTLEDKHNQLNQTLRSRHMHMIAIGKQNAWMQETRHKLTESQEDRLVQVSSSDLVEHWRPEVLHHCSLIS